jgi:hypothetical protein
VGAAVRAQDDQIGPLVPGEAQDHVRGEAVFQAVLDRRRGAIGLHALQHPPQVLVVVLVLAPGDLLAVGQRRRDDVQHHESAAVVARQGTGQAEGGVGLLREVGRVQDGLER